MKKALLAISILSSTLTFAQTTQYDGNGKNSFGGAVGQGKFEITDKGDSVCFLLTKGTATFDSVLVFYIDGANGGISTTANLAAGTDLYSTAVSGNYSATQKSVLNFAPDFQPDFSVVFNKDGGKIYFFEKDSLGNDVIMPGADVVLSPIGTNASPTYSGTIAKADVSVTGPVDFKLFGTYVGANASRSNEGFGVSFDGYNPESYADYSPNSYLTYSSNAALPVSLVDFKASLINNKVQVQWTVAQETNVDEYQVQRSSNGIQFSTITTVVARNVSNSIRYSFNDDVAVKGLNYYRIVTKEKGRSDISKVVAVKFGGDRNNFKVNQVGNKLNLRLNGLIAGTYRLSLYNNNGQLLQTETIQHDGNVVVKQVDIKSNIIKGIYRVVLQSQSIKLNQSVLLQ